MSSERRRSPRQAVNRLAKLQLATGTLPRDCMVTDISEGGVRLHVEGLDVPDHFTLLLSTEGRQVKPRDCRVIWRLGYELGAEFVDRTDRGGGREFAVSRKSRPV